MRRGCWRWTLRPWPFCGIGGPRWRIWRFGPNHRLSPILSSSLQRQWGHPANPDTFTHRFGALCDAMEAPALKRLRKKHPKAKRADLAPKDLWPYRFHDLRHFSVTTLIAAGVDVRTVAERHGMPRATMTLDRYAHALPERDRAAADVLGTALILIDHQGCRAIFTIEI